MTELDNIILSFCKREEEAGCYKYKVAGVDIYNLVRFRLRNDYLQSKGYSFVEKYEGANLLAVFKTFIVSAFQLSKLFLLRKKCDVFFYSFSHHL